MKVLLHQSCLLVLLSIAATSCEVAGESEVDWANVSTSFSMYVHNRTESNARTAIDALPKERVSWGARSDEHGEALEVISDGLLVLSREIESAHPEAAQLAFALYNVLDGSGLEDLSIMLGKLIRIAPELFLSELGSQPDGFCCLGGLVANLGEKYVDRLEAQCEELGQRMKAIRGVTGEQYAVAREKAMAALASSTAICHEPPNRALQLTLDPPAAFAVAKPTSASSAAELGC